MLMSSASNATEMSSAQVKPPVLSVAWTILSAHQFKRASVSRPGPEDPAGSRRGKFLSLRARGNSPVANQPA